jgi:putative transposase
LETVENNHKELSINRQCDLLGVPRSTYYYEPIPESKYNLKLMREIDEIYLENPSFGRRLMTASLRNKGYEVNSKRVLRLMRLMGIEALYPKPKIRTTVPGVIKFPYLLKDLKILSPNQAWGTDITYVPMEDGFLYLVAFLDLYSRYVLSWKLSNSLDSAFCVEALNMALQHAIPKIINSDQGVQYTSHAYLNLVQEKDVCISMSGKGKCWDNIFVERLWRTVKQDEIYLKQYENYNDANESISCFFNRYNKQRPHSSLNYRTPLEVYLNG